MNGQVQQTLPRWVWVPAGIALALLVLPIVALVWRVDVATLPAAIGSDEAREALWLSVTTAAAATVICVLLGGPLALAIARAPRRAASVLRAVVLVPLVLPPLVGGLALLALFGRAGLAGGVLEAWGISLPFTTAAVVVAQAFVALPFFVITVESTLRTSGTRFEAVAATLGASRARVLTRVTIPLVLPGVVGGTVLCFARAIGEFGATALFAGNAPGVTRTMPLAIYTAFNGAGATQESATALALMLVVAALVVVLGLRSWREDTVR
ncbi:ABC transporter permease [Okibacterium endophyticum]